MKNTQEIKRIYRHKRVRKKMYGTNERPRLCVHRSLKNMQAHLIDDSLGRVLFGLSTLNKGIRQKVKSGGNIAAATLLGEEFAKIVKEKGITKLCFDRGGYLYHGRVKAFAEAVRKNGVEF